jgi:hypothetical protein
VHTCLEAQVRIDNKVVETDRNIDLVQVDLEKMWRIRRASKGYFTSWESVESVSTWKREVCDVAVILGGC